MGTTESVSGRAQSVPRQSIRCTHTPCGTFTRPARDRRDSEVEGELKLGCPESPDGASLSHRGAIGSLVKWGWRCVVIPEQEGWYTDPWGHHDARWMSEGVPTKLVRDGKLESYDDPPDSSPSQAWLPIEPLPGSQTALDTLRADDLEAEAIPSLSELNKREDSAAITARAHPWFVARDWVPSSRRGVPSYKAEPATRLRRAALIVGGVLAGVIVLLSSCLWVVRAIGLLTPPPPMWGGVVIASVIALVAPVGTYLSWRSDRRAQVPRTRRIQRAEQVGGLLGFLMLVLFALSVGAP